MELLASIINHVDTYNFTYSDTENIPSIGHLHMLAVHNSGLPQLNHSCYCKELYRVEQL